MAMTINNKKCTVNEFAKAVIAEQLIKLEEGSYKEEYKGELTEKQFELVDIQVKKRIDGLWKYMGIDDLHKKYGA